MAATKTLHWKSIYLGGEKYKTKLRYILELWWWERWCIFSYTFIYYIYFLNLWMVMFMMAVIFINRQAFHKNTSKYWQFWFIEKGTYERECDFFPPHFLHPLAILQIIDLSSFPSWGSESNPKRRKLQAARARGGKVEEQNLLIEVLHKPNFICYVKNSPI